MNWFKRKWEYVKFSDKFYRALIAPFDKILFPVVDAQALRKDRTRGEVPFNKLPHVADIYNEKWKAVADDMRTIFRIDENLFHRKIWESIHIIYILKEAGYLFHKSQGLAIGAGREEILYYLAHKISKIFAIDLYEGTYVGGEDEPDIPEHPEKYAPFFYPREKLVVKKMDARTLDFPENRFEFVISLSSIEHFGSAEDIIRSVQEMFRVLKPGGACVISTELGLNRRARDIPNTRIFRLAELQDLFAANGFVRGHETIDLQIEDQYLKEWVKLPHNIYKSPHVVVRFFSTIFSSLCLFLQKPGHAVLKGPWQKISEFQQYKYRGELRVTIENFRVQQGSPFRLNINVKNTSNFFWFTNGYSHRIAIAVKLLRSDGDVMDHFFAEIVIPHHIDINDSLTFKAKLAQNLMPGRYKLFFDLKKERVLGFSDQGNPPCVTDIEIYR